MTFARRAALLLSMLGALTACVTGHHATGAKCRTAPALGRFHPATDLFVANFDSKPDPDDLHSVAATAMMLRDPRFACVRHVATAGAYGRQAGAFIDAPKLFDLAFPGNWVDAHADRPAAVAALTARMLATLQAGGDIWVMEAGQSDVTAAVLANLRQRAPDIDTKRHVHVVQHSSWNESATVRSALDLVRSQTDYLKIPDGNTVGNGSPGFNTPDGSAWPALLSDPKSGATWVEARQRALTANATSLYRNPGIAAGGLDFSDTAEAAYIFGFEGLRDVDAYVAAFAQRD